ncbi:protein spire homolog 1-like [Rhinoderma darwinii]|uniref:protein spire homolog 1-like n=1 Tax=Rhinoderma darwinii TaxID=43563 RepID=UPI003F68122B
MNERGPAELHGKVRLKDVLKGSGQPVSEEQAWALCYQCGRELKQMILRDGYFPVLRGTEHIYIHHDGAVSFVDTTGAKDSKLSEKRVIERLGKAVYAALDWGLSSEIERVLGDSLDRLLFYMLGLHTPNSKSPAAKRLAFTLNDIIKECVERLFVPSEASAHYIAVCRIQYTEYKDIDRLLQTIQFSKQSLRRLDSTEELEKEVLEMYNWSALWSNVMNELCLGVSLRSVDRWSYAAMSVEYELTPYEQLMNDIRSKRLHLRPVEIKSSPKDDVQEDSVITDNLDTSWSNVMTELRLGVSLRSVDRWSYAALPVEYELTPYELLMNDIRSQRHHLRPVKECDQSKSSRSEDDVILDLIRTHTLKPASERKLKERTPVEPSLHALLMSEIKSSKTLRSTLDVKRSLMQASTDEELKISNNLNSLPHEYSLYSCRMGNRWSRLPVMNPLDNGVDGRISGHPEFSYESSSEHKFSHLTSSSTDFSFIPVLTSSQLDLRMNSISNSEKQMSYGHKRSSSYEGSFQGSSCRQSWRAPKIRLPPTISELILLRRSIIKTEMLLFASSKDFPGYKVCSSCFRKTLFFSWPFSCKFCERTICPECHVEMLMPFKQCMYLPVSFFKALVLTRDNDPFCQAQKNHMFCREVVHWDYSSVPLVFEPKDKAEDLSFHKRIMYNWTSMDICIKCEEYILDVLDMSHHSEFTGSALKSRSLSESSAILLRH